MIFDLHCDTILKVYKYNTALRENDYHIDVKKLIDGPSFAQFFAMFVDLASTNDANRTCHEMIDRYETELLLNPEVVSALSYEDIMEIRQKGKIAGILTIEEGGVLNGQISELIKFYERGCRSITLTWNYENALGFPNALDREKGLKPFGVEVVKKMNELGMLIDVSHLSDAGFWDCIKHSSQPIIASHSNARAVCDQGRNLTDDMIVALHKNGGLMGMNFCSFFLDSSQVSKVQDIVKHILHIKRLVGVEVIGLGSDFDGIGGTLEIGNMGEMYKLKDALKEAGLSSNEIEMIFYKNADRVMQAVLK